MAAGKVSWAGLAWFVVFKSPLLLQEEPTFQGSVTFPLLLFVFSPFLTISHIWYTQLQWLASVQKCDFLRADSPVPLCMSQKRTACYTRLPAPFSQENMCGPIPTNPEDQECLDVFLSLVATIIKMNSSAQNVKTHCYYTSSSIDDKLWKTSVSYIVFNIRSCLTQCILEMFIVSKQKLPLTSEMEPVQWSFISLSDVHPSLSKGQTLRNKWQGASLHFIMTFLFAVCVQHI